MEGETSATAIFRCTDGRMATFRADVTVGVVAHSGERLNNLFIPLNLVKMEILHTEHPFFNFFLAACPFLHITGSKGELVVSGG